MTTDSLFSGVLTLSLLAAGALAFGSDLAASQPAAPSVSTVVAAKAAPAARVHVAQGTTRTVRVASL